MQGREKKNLGKRRERGERKNEILNSCDCESSRTGFSKSSASFFFSFFFSTKKPSREMKNLAIKILRG